MSVSTPNQDTRRDLSGRSTPVIDPGNAYDERTPLLGEPGEGRRPRAALWSSTVWAQSKGMVLVMLSQFFGASMNVMTQVLEVKGKNGEGLHPFQILFARMSITVVVSYLYMWYAGVPHPFGTRPVFGLLLLRAAGGFWGVYGLYYSVQYLALSEATVLTFLAPILSCYACSFFIPNETFTWKQQLAGLVSLGGVVLIARPFSAASRPQTPPAGPGIEDSPRGSEADHVAATIMALVGVMGASCAYTAIRMIGQRCHPLVSVTYFSSFTTIVSLVAMLTLPSVPLELPGTSMEWSLLVGLGVCGFLLQFLLTAGLAYVPPSRASEKNAPGEEGGDETDGDGDGNDDDDDRPQERSTTSSGSRATSMLYTQMVFALLYDKMVWGRTLSIVSWIGSGLIIGSALYVAVARERGPR